MTARVLIVDDHTVLSQALANALTLHGISEVQVATPHQLDGEALLTLASSWSPDVVLLDLFLGEGRKSTPLVPALRATGAAVVVLTASEDRAVWAEALEAGAVGVLPKSVAFDELVASVHRAASGQMLMAGGERAQLMDELTRSRKADQDRLGPFQRLSAREQEVLAGLIAGQAAKQIARDLGVSLPTVRTQIRSLFDKLGVNSQRAAVTVALGAGWKSDRAD
jgi:DNA-binding NarL/FixJ family response regulator